MCTFAKFKTLQDSKKSSHLLHTIPPFIFVELRGHKKSVLLPILNLPCCEAIVFSVEKERSGFRSMSSIYQPISLKFPSTCDWLAASFLNPDQLTKLARHILVPDRLSRQLKSLLSFSMSIFPNAKMQRATSYDRAYLSLAGPGVSREVVTQALMHTVANNSIF